MSINIKNVEVEKIVRLLAKMRKESITTIILKALRMELKKEEGRVFPRSLSEELTEISQRCAALNDLDKRSPEEILGYNQHGLPGE